MPRPPPSPDDTPQGERGHGADVRDCFAAIARRQAAAVEERAGQALARNDAESLHQLRVAIRRARAAFSLFRRATRGRCRLPLARELRRLQRRLGAAREWDVLVEETLAGLPRRLRARPATRLLIRRAERRRDESRKQARAALRDPASIATLRRLAAWPERQFGIRGLARWDAEALAQPAARAADAAIRRHHRRARKLGRRLRELDTAAVHRLRIRIKKLRYAIELLDGPEGSPWPGRRTRRYLAALRDLQQALGAWHDLTVAEARLAALDTRGAAAVADWLAARREAMREETLACWRRFARRRPFWGPG